MSGLWLLILSSQFSLRPPLVEGHCLEVLVRAVDLRSGPGQGCLPPRVLGRKQPSRLLGEYFTASNGIKLFTLQEIERH